jgi:mannose-6-phosphate isomerase-like protein (cupin superfamily)
MDGDQISEIKRSLKQAGYLLYVYSYPGGMCFPVHTHDHEMIHVVLSGSLKITIDGFDNILTPGERFTVPAGVSHSAEVFGDQPVVCLDATKPM